MNKKVNISAIKSKMHFIYKDEREKNIAAIVIYNKDGKFFFDPEYKNEMSNLEVEALLLRGALVNRGGKYYRPSSFNENNVSFSDAVINPEDIEVDLSGYATKDELNAKADINDIPTKLSDLQNDTNFLTSIPSEYVTDTELNNKGYLTQHQSLEDYATKSYVSSEIAKAQLEGGEVDLDPYALKEDIPTKLSDLQNDTNFLTSIPSEYVTDTELNNKGYLTQHQSLEDYATKSYVSSEIAKAQLEGGEVDLDPYALKEDIPTKLSDLENDMFFGNDGTIPDGSITKDKLASDIDIDHSDIRSVVTFKEHVIGGDLRFIDGYLKYDGQVSPLNGLVYTPDYIDVIPGGEYIVGDGGGYGDSGLCFYEDDVFIEGRKIITLVGTKIKIPDNANKMRLCASATKCNEFTMTLVNTPLWDEFDMIKADIESINTDQSKIVFKPGEAFSINRKIDNSSPACGGTLMSITAYHNRAVYVTSFEIKLGKGTNILYKAEFDMMDSSSANLTILEKIGEIEGDDGYVVYEPPTPIKLQPKQFIMMANTISNVHYQQNTLESEDRYFYLPDSYNVAVGDTISKSSVFQGNHQEFMFVGEVHYAELTPDNISDVIDNLKKENVRLNDIADEHSEYINNIKQSSLKKHQYISVFYDNFNKLNEEWDINEDSWLIDEDARELRSQKNGDVSSKNGCITLNKIYHADKRVMRVLIKFSEDTIFDVGFNNASGHSDSTGRFRVNLQTKKMVIYNGFTSVYATGDITMDIDSSKYYYIELERYKQFAFLSVIDYITGDKNTVSYEFANGYFMGEQYTLGVMSGGMVIIKEFNISIQNHPLVYIVGDSITAGVASGEGGWANRLGEILDERVVISARGNDSAPSTVLKFESEMKHIRPDYLLWCHGHNGEGITKERVAEVQNLCDQINCKLLINHICCSEGGVQDRVNKVVEELGYRGARFDIATAINGDPTHSSDGSSGCDLTLFSDGIHPNLLGSQRCFDRLLLDLPELFLK